MELTATEQETSRYRRTLADHATGLVTEHAPGTCFPRPATSPGGL